MYHVETYTPGPPDILGFKKICRQEAHTIDTIGHLFIAIRELFERGHQPNDNILQNTDVSFTHR